MKELIFKLDDLIKTLKNNNKESFLFFKEQRDFIFKRENSFAALERLRKSNSIVQYGDFSFDEEKLYNEMYDVLEKIYKEL